MIPTLHTAKETAPLVRKSVGWLYRAARAGRIPATRIGGNWSWTDEQIKQIIDEAARAANPQPPREKAPKPATRENSVHRRTRQPAATRSDIPKADRTVSRLYRQGAA